MWEKSWPLDSSDSHAISFLQHQTNKAFKGMINTHILISKMRHDVDFLIIFTWNKEKYVYPFYFFNQQWLWIVQTKSGQFQSKRVSVRPRIEAKNTETIRDSPFVRRGETHGGAIQGSVSDVPFHKKKISEVRWKFLILHTGWCLKIAASVDLMWCN